MPKGYAPVSGLASPRFAGIRTFARLPHVRELAGVDVAIVGAPFDTGVTYRVGARFGPAAVREMSAMLRTYHPSLDVDVYEVLSVVDYGDLPVVPGYIEDSYQRIEQGLLPLLEHDVVPLVIGGDHSITLAELRAVARRYGRVGFIQFDSHTDTWDEYWGKKYTHGTPFRRAVEEGLIETTRAIQVGMRGSLYGPEDLDQSRELGFEVWTADDVRRTGLGARDRSDPAPSRPGAGLRELRYRLPRSGVCARYRDTGGRGVHDARSARTLAWTGRCGHRGSRYGGGPARP
jgi:agmatinase